MTNISIVAVHCVKSDAMSNVMKMYADWLRAEPNFSVKCYGYSSEYTQEELPFQTVENSASLLLDAHFQHSDIIIFQYGIYYPLMDLIALAPNHAKVLAIFHNVTPKEFIAPQHHGLIDKSFEQIYNLQSLDYVICDSPTNLKELRARGINTPATVLPLWYKKMYGTPRYKPSFYDGVIRLVFLGRFVRSKGPMDLLQAVALYMAQTVQTDAKRQLRLTFMSNRLHSEPALLALAQEQAQALEQQYAGRLQIEFLFNVSDDEKFQVLQEADIFTLPTYHEGFCVPVIEALSNGCRVVAYNNSNIPFVAGQDAHLAQTGDIASLTAHIGAAVATVTAAEWWLEGEASYAAFVDRNSTHLAQFSPELAKQRLLGLFSALLKTNAHDKPVDGLGDAARAALSKVETPQLSRPLGVNAVGFFSGLLGLGEAARAMVHGLATQDHLPEPMPYQLADFRVSHQPAMVDATFDAFDADFKYAFNLLMLNPPEHASMLKQYGVEQFRGRYNIGLWYWELVDIIPEWNHCFKLIDELWVTTNYIRDNMLQCSPVPVHKVTIPILIDSTKVQVSRAAFKLPESTFLFIFAFDHNSVMARKNPMAVVDAFRLAFGDRQDVGLVIKTINGDQHPEREQKLRDATQGLNTFFFDGDMERYESFSLFASCDSFVSLHRAEGLGLAMAEAMLLGKPVIATAYSGNMEFMNHTNSLPVRYKLVEIEQDKNLYRKGQWWAEPDVAHAAQCMQLLAGDAALCKTLGERAKAHIETHFSAEKSGQSMHNRIEHLAKTRGAGWGFSA